ncbi:hypothetical protein [Nonomuraea typhae]|uniref:hypothetical protein n=1 Tax=Nonomuraea typhae TaxID=2603600 RepID=UPI0012FAD966|nr:hypothetical protein [Nonomuraea typhae]
MRRITAIALLMPILVACQNSPPPQAQKSRVPSPSASLTSDKFSTGGDADDDPCTRVVSSIGYAGLLLLPAGKEDEQNFENAVLGRLAELRGIVREFGPRLPGGLRGEAESVEKATQGLAKADTPRKTQVAFLKDYRAAADRIVQGCKTS